MSSTAILDEKVQNGQTEKTEKTATCNITYNRDGVEDWVNVLSFKTRVVLSLHISSLQRSWGTFTDEERKVLSRLMQGQAQRQEELTYSEMRIFQGAVDRAGRSAQMEKYIELVYDIPVGPNGQGIYPNPSHLLRRIGFRLNLSCWVLPMRLLPKDLIADMVSNGVNVHLLDFAEHEMDRIRELARENLKADTGRIQESMLRSIDSASEQLRVVLSRQGTTDEESGKEYPQLTAKEQRKAQLYRNNRIKGAIKAAQDALKDALECAIHFDETENLEDCFKGLSKAIESRLELLSQMQNETIRA